MIRRIIKDGIKKSVSQGKSILLLGPRQTGKTTILKSFDADLTLNLTFSKERLRYEKNPELFTSEVQALKSKGKRPIVFIDEIQKVPALLDEIQGLIDSKAAQFMLTGSSARKLRLGVKTNWLPGRLRLFRLDPISVSEQAPQKIEDALLYGSLPGILTQKDLMDRESDLMSYVDTYLEEEVRQEGLVRSLGPFARFLELAAIESGNILNFSKISSDLGPSIPTVKSYFEVLFDCLIAENIPPITDTLSRKKLTKTSKSLFFDLGVRRLAAREGTRLIPERMGALFEQWVGLEILRHIRQTEINAQLKFWRDPDGPEVDWVFEHEKRGIPIEVKWTEKPKSTDARFLEVFLDEYQEAKRGFIICRTPRKVKLTDRVVAIPWQELTAALE